MKVLRYSTQIHKWVGLVVGLQVLFWVGGGLVMTAIPIATVRSEHRLKASTPAALPLEQIALALGDSPALFVLDNMEQLALEGAPIVHALLHRIPNLKVEVLVVHTNKMAFGAYRGPSGPQTVFAVESHTDAIAKQLGMDALEFRLKNIFVDGDTGHTGHTVTSTCT